MCRSALLVSSTCRTRAYREGSTCFSLPVTSLWTVDLEVPKKWAVSRTVAPFCTMYHMDTDGCEWDGCMGVDRAGRLYEIDPEEGIAYEAETYLADAIRFDKNKAIYFEVA